MSRIKNLSMYNKCMKDLHDFGYVKYIPSFHPELGSTIYIMDKNETPVISKESKNKKTCKSLIYRF